MEEAYSNLNNAYLQIKGMIVVEGFYALVAGFVITTFVFNHQGDGSRRQGIQCKTVL